MSITLRQLFASVLAGDVPKPGMTMRAGRHGERVSLLGYGAMRLPTVDGGHAAGRVGKPVEGYSSAGIDQAAVNEHIDYALSHGVN